MASLMKLAINMARNRKYGFTLFSALLAVMSEPLFNVASTTKTPKLKPLTIRFLRGKCCCNGGVPGKTQ